METPSIPDKLYFKIGEVSDLVGVKPYVLRYWESEFKDVTPVKSRTNQRLYKKKDVEILLRIRQLLYRERFTISGAKKKLKEEYHQSKQETPDEQLGLSLEQLPDLQEVNATFQEIHERLFALIEDMQETIKG